MMTKESRKEAIRKFKERKPQLGAFAIRCTATGQVWVGASRNLDATRNGSWAFLRNAGHPDKSLQREWDLHGEPAFQYEILEKLEEDLPVIAIADQLNESKRRWVERLSARPMSP